MILRTLALLAATVLVTSACVVESRPDPELCGQQSIELSTALSADALDPADLAACRGQRVMLMVASEVDGVLHIHGYDSEVPAFEVRSGEEQSISFDAGRSGQFPIEFHASDDPAGVGVGIFTVHEP